MRLLSHRCGIVAALATAAALAGCADIDLTNQQAWFAKPLDVTGRNAGYTFSELQETKQRKRAIAANDLVNSNGTCASRPMPAAAPAPPAAAAGQAAGTPAPAQTTESLLGGGIALGMSECDVVFRAGQPSAVQIGSNPGGDRTAVLTYGAGPRPGIYHFVRGELTEMDRIETPAAPPPTETAKKKSPKSPKSAKSNKPQKKNDQS